MMNQNNTAGHAGIEACGEKCGCSMKQEVHNETSGMCHENVLRQASSSGIPSEYLETPYLDKLASQTKSQRILNMITLAYYQGQVRGLIIADQCKHFLSALEASD